MKTYLSVSIGLGSVTTVILGLALAGCGSQQGPQANEPGGKPAAHNSLVHVNEASFQQEVLSQTGIVVVDFWAPWCGPCRMIAPTLEKLSSEYRGRIKVCKVNTDQNQALASKYKIKGIPALLVFRGGRVIDSRVGAMPEKDYRQWFNQLL